jgi:hypothetical protein
MSTSLSIKYLSIAENHAASQGSATATALLARLGRSAASLRRRSTERRMALTLQALNHPGLIADFQQASRQR